MDLDIRTKDIEISDGIREHAAKRVGHGLDRFASHIDVVHLTVSEQHPTKGAPAKHCHVRVVGREGWQVNIESEEGELLASIDNGIHRAATAVRRHVDKVTNHSAA